MKSSRINNKVVTTFSDFAPFEALNAKFQPVWQLEQSVGLVVELSREDVFDTNRITEAKGEVV